MCWQFHLPFSLVLEAKPDIFSSERLVHGTERFELTLQSALLFLVKVADHRLGPVGCKPRSLSDDLRWVADVIQERLVDGSQGSAAWSCKRVTALWWFGQFPLSYQDNVLSRELLLKLPHETLADLLESFTKTKWNVDDNSFAAT